MTKFLKLDCCNICHCEEHSYATRQSRKNDTKCHASEGWHPEKLLNLELLRPIGLAMTIEESN